MFMKIAHCTIHEESTNDTKRKCKMILPCLCNTIQNPIEEKIQPTFQMEAVFFVVNTIRVTRISLSVSMPDLYANPIDDPNKSN